MSDPVSDGGGPESYLEIQMDRSTIVLAIAGLVALLVLAFLLGSWTAGRNPDAAEATGGDGEEAALATEEASGRAPAIEEVDVDVDGDPPFGVQPVSAAGAPPLTAVPSPRSGSRGAGVVGDGEPSSGASSTSTSSPKPTRVATTAPPLKTPGRAPAAAAPPDSADGWVVQVAALTDRAEADALRKRLESKGHPVNIREEGGYFKVHVGPFAAKPDADRAASRLGREDRLGTWVKKP